MEELQKWEFYAEDLLAFAEPTLLQRRQSDVVVAAVPISGDSARR